MNGTFIFEHDRFDSGADLAVCYRGLGGRGGQDEVEAACLGLITQLELLYREPEHNLDFPSVQDVAASIVPDHLDVDALVQTISIHEMGRLSEDNHRALTRLKDDFELIVISNLWSDAAMIRDYLATELSPDFFRVMVFSSDMGVNKPAVEIFLHALKLADVGVSESAMVGDDLYRDIDPAHSLGMQTIHLGAGSSTLGNADYAAVDLSGLF